MELQVIVRVDLLPQVIMNMAVFVSVGIMIGAITQRRNMYSRWVITAVLGLVLSLCIETMQFLFNKGFAEFDDIIHNTLGCIIGFVIYIGIEMVFAIPRKTP